MDDLKKFYNTNKRQINNLLTCIFVFTFLHIFIKYIFVNVVPFVIGFVIYLILDPITSFFEEKTKLPRWFLSLASILFLITIIGSIGAILVISIISQGESFIENSSIYIDQFNALLNKGEDFFINLFFLVPISLKEFSVEFFTNNLNIITASLTEIVKHISISFAKAIPKTIVYFFIGLISSFFMLKDKVLIKSYLKRKSPKFLSSSIIKIKNEIMFALGGYFKSQLILMSFTGFISFIGLSILGSPYSLFIAFLIAIIDALPFFGSGFILWPWAAYLLITGAYSDSIILMATYVCVLIFRQIMEPRILGQQIGLHPLVTLMSIFIGLNLFGIIGLIIGPVSVVICKSIFENNN